MLAGGLMKLEHYSLEKLKKEVIDIVEEFLPLGRYKIFFFGSRVNKKGDERSDIDIGIEGSDPIPIEIMAKIKDRVSELPILYRIDVVDFRRVGKDFYETAKQDIELISP